MSCHFCAARPQNGVERGSQRALIAWVQSQLLPDILISLVTHSQYRIEILWSQVATALLVGCSSASSV